MDRVVHAVSAIFGAVIGFMFGEVTGLLIALVFMMTIDYTTGVIAAYYKHQLSSSVGFKGIFKKIIILCLVSVAHMIDVHVIGSNAVVMSASIMFYIANEGISILENAAAMEIPLPPALIKALKQISDSQKMKKDDKEKDKDDEEDKEDKKNGKDD